tara:strand:- start:8036 stop:8251 length:216 start_codon:yes stop_codon:yes gene_type:complete
MKFNLDLKSIIALATILFAIAGFYYTTKNNKHILSLEIKALQTENHDVRKRLDSLDKKTNRMNKQLRELKQ